MFLSRGDSDRDVFNEKPLKEEQMAATKSGGSSRICMQPNGNTAHIHGRYTVQTVFLIVSEVNFNLILRERETESGREFEREEYINRERGIGGRKRLFLLFCSCPKTVENFCVCASNGYYNGHIFHRVIKQFMIQIANRRPHR